MRGVSDEMAFVEDCPASPLAHLLASRGSGDAFALRKYSERRPISVSIYLTRACNLRCLTCYEAAGDPLRGEPGPGGWMRVIEGLADLGVEHVYLLGGEPTLLGRRGLADVVGYASEYGMAVAMGTNGLLVDRGMAEDLARAGLEQAQVSIDGSTPDVNDLIRGKGSFDAAIRAIGNLRGAGITVTTSMTLTGLNYHQAVEFVELSERLGAAVATLIPVQEFGRASASLVPSPGQLRRVYASLRARASGIPVVLNGFRFYLEDLIGVGLRAGRILGNTGSREAASCPAGRNRFVVDSNGDVYGCELLTGNRFREGNALRDDLSEIWTNGFRAFRGRSPERMEGCDRCPIRSVCNSGCPARAYGRRGTLLAKDPLCGLRAELDRSFIIVRGSMGPHEGGVQGALGREGGEGAGRQGGAGIDVERDPRARHHDKVAREGGGRGSDLRDEALRIEPRIRGGGPLASLGARDIRPPGVHARYGGFQRIRAGGGGLHIHTAERGARLLDRGQRLLVHLHDTVEADCRAAPPRWPTRR
jgi:radical SAM protein with 4Fe4S-binding SPASM domain